MNKTEWKESIQKACEDAGTYRPFFDSVIETLAELMETRDNAREKFEQLGGQTIVRHTNKAGATNLVKNPALVVLMDCNAQALNYWRDLGLTPAGLKKLSAMAVEPSKEKSASLEDLLAKIV